MMNSTNITATGPHVGDRQFADLIERITRDIEQRKPIDLDSYVREHPQYADRLRQLLPAMKMLNAASAEVDSGRDASTSEPTDGSLQQQNLGDYRILREAGRGGMGIVYEAHQLSLGRRVALKVLPFAAVMNQRQLQRFKNEAHIAAQLIHQNIVPVYSVGSDELARMRLGLSQLPAVALSSCGIA